MEYVALRHLPLKLGKGLHHISKKYHGGSVLPGFIEAYLQNVPGYDHHLGGVGSAWEGFIPYSFLTQEF